MRGPIVIVLLAGCAAGCAYGMTEKKFRAAHSPRGIETRITTSDAVFAGELIEVREAGLVLLSETMFRLAPTGTTETAERRLRLIPYAAVLVSRFEQLDQRVYIFAGRVPSGNGREQLRLVSRFPQGLSPEVLSRLLEEHGQTELAGIQP
jgi:hypothetical protein